MTTPDPAGHRWRRKWLVGGALVVVLAVAAAFRFADLGWGLRHQAEPDEKVFVENAARMAHDRTLDHEYYFYPGLPFDVLALVLGLRGTPRNPDPAAYLAARGLLAAMSTATVALVFLLGRARIGVAAGLAGALFLAVSPVDIFVPHKVRPDAMLGTFALLALLALGSMGTGTRADAGAGAALGAASAVKFSAILLGPSVALYWIMAGRRRWVSLAIVCGVAALVYFAFTPYALIHAREFVQGMAGQFEQHYRHEPAPYWSMVLVYLAVVVKAFGPVALLAVLALPLAIRDWRRWAPLVVFPLTAILVFSTSDVRHERFVAPTFGVIALLAGGLVEAVARRRPAAATALAVVAAAFPFARSLDQAADLARPVTMDRVADWMTASAPSGAKVLSLFPPLVLDEKRFEVFPIKVSTGVFPNMLDNWLALGPHLAREADFVVASPTDRRHDAAGRGLERVFRADPESNLSGPPLEILRVPDSARARFDRISLSHAALAASENAADLTKLRDGDRSTAWRTLGEQRPGQWIEARWDAAVPLARVVLDLGEKPQRWGRRLEVSVTRDGRTWTPVFSALANGPIDDVAPEEGPSAQVLVFEAACASGVRITQTGRSERRWDVAELGLDAERTPCAPLP